MYVPESDIACNNIGLDPVGALGAQGYKTPPKSVRIVGRAIRSLPGIEVGTDPFERKFGHILLVVQASKAVRGPDGIRDASIEDRWWAAETGERLMASGRIPWVVEVRDEELCPDYPPEALLDVLRTRALLWPEWILTGGPYIPSPRDLALAIVLHCRKRGRWGDPLIVETVAACDDLYNILNGTPPHTFQRAFFDVKKEVEDDFNV